MTQDHPKAIGHSHKALAGIATAVAFLIIVSFTFLEKKTEKYSNLLSYTGSETGRISATLQDTGGTTELGAEARSFNLPETKKLSLPYMLSSSLYTGDTGARDFVFTVSQDRKKIGVLIDGFSPEDRVTLALNDRAAFTDIPMDWSGRMEFVSDLAGNGSVEACIDIAGRDIRVCHHIPEDLGA
jgi:hypothetical protein